MQDRGRQQVLPPTFRAFLEGRSRTLPGFFRDQIRRDLGPMWEWLPPEALSHDVDTSPESRPTLSVVERGTGYATA